MLERQQAIGIAGALPSEVSGCGQLRGQSGGRLAPGVCFKANGRDRTSPKLPIRLYARYARLGRLMACAGARRERATGRATESPLYGF
jgi:hypothetical protein